MIELKNGCKTYTSKKGKNTKALSNIHLKLSSKGMTFIVGKSGSGKSTLLNILGGLDKIDTGELLIYNEDSSLFTEQDFDSYRNTYVGFIFQEFHLLEDYNVEQNIKIALELQQREVRDEEIDILLDKMDLKDLKHRKINELSGGQKQRVAILRAIIKNPKLILADEPTGNLDSVMGKQVMDLLKEISFEKQVVVVTHDMEFAQIYGDRILELKDGYIIKDTNPSIEETKEKYQTKKAHLPWKDSFLLGFNSLKEKKIRLFFTTILISLSLILLGLMDTLSHYNVALGHAKLLKEKKEKFVQIEKVIAREDQYYYTSRIPLNLNGKTIEEINNFIKQRGRKVYKINENGLLDLFQAFHCGRNYNMFPIGYRTNTIELEIVEDNTFSYPSTLKIIGRKPEKEDEVLISNVLAWHMIEWGVEIPNQEELFYPESYEEILKQENYYLGSYNQVKIVGIIDYDTKEAKKFEKEYEQDPYSIPKEEGQILEEYNTKLLYTYNKIFVKEGFVSHLHINNQVKLDESYNYCILSDTLHFSDSFHLDFYNQDVSPVAPTYINDTLEYYDGNNWVRKSTLNKDEVVLHILKLEDFDYQDYQRNLQRFLNKRKGEDAFLLEKEFFVEYIKQFDILGKKIRIDVSKIGSGNIGNTLSEEMTIVGVYGIFTSKENKELYISQDALTEYRVEQFPVTSIFVFEDNEKELKKLIEKFPYEEELSLRSIYSSDLNYVVSKVKILKKESFYISIILLCFTCILITNFMFASIKSRKKEIGILRALGASKKDILKIFLLEGFLLAIISYLLVVLGINLFSHYLNGMYLEDINNLLTPFIVTIRQYILLFFFVYILIFITSIIPLMKCSKMRPIDAILNK